MLTPFGWPELPMSQSSFAMVKLLSTMTILIRIRILIRILITILSIIIIVRD